jgi:hypothetical protein
VNEGKAGILDSESVVAALSEVYEAHKRPNMHDDTPPFYFKGARHRVGLSTHNNTATHVCPKQEMRKGVGCEECLINRTSLREKV